jgi:hypothetical protein
MSPGMATRHAWRRAPHRVQSIFRSQNKKPLPGVKSPREGPEKHDYSLSKAAVSNGSSLNPPVYSSGVSSV